MLKKSIIFIIIIIAIISLYDMSYKKDIKVRRETPTNQRLDILKNLYKIICESSENNKLFIVYGTLLGKIRNNDLICYDFDLDFGIMNENYKKIKEMIKKKLKNNNEYKFIDKDILFWKSFTIVHNKTKINADIFCYNYSGNKIWRSVPEVYSKFYLGEKIHKMDRDWVLPLKESEFLNHKIFIPNKPDMLLKNWYGKSYMTPDHICDESCDVCKKINI